MGDVHDAILDTADMIEGVIAANGLASPVADRLRSDLWEVLGFEATPVRTRVA